MKKYLIIWGIYTARSTQIAFASRSGAFFFLLGKILRFLFYFTFLFLILQRTQTIAGYTLWQVALIFATYNLVDILTQFLLRDVYRFRSFIITGYFDHILLKPISPLFKCLFGGSDMLDLLTLFPLMTFLIFVSHQIGTITPLQIMLYLLLVGNAFIIALSFHIFVLALGVISTEVDNAIWLFRNVTDMGRIPVDVYREPLRFILTFIIPVAALITIPTKALLGLVTLEGVVLAGMFSVLLFLGSLGAWKYALRQYASVSS